MRLHEIGFSVVSFLVLNFPSNDKFVKNKTKKRVYSTTSILLCQSDAGTESTALPIPGVVAKQVLREYGITGSV